MSDIFTGSVFGRLPSARRLLATTSLVVFVVELAVMFGLELFGLRMPPLMLALLDAIILTAIMVPLLVVFLYRPLFRAIDEIMDMEEHMMREQGLRRVHGAAGPSPETAPPLALRRSARRSRAS